MASIAPGSEGPQLPCPSRLISSTRFDLSGAARASKRSFNPESAEPFGPPFLFRFFGARLHDEGQEVDQALYKANPGQMTTGS